MKLSFAKTRCRLLAITSTESCMFYELHLLARQFFTKYIALDAINVNYIHTKAKTK